MAEATQPRTRRLSSLVTPKRELKGPNQLEFPSPLLTDPTTPRYVPWTNSLEELDRKFPALVAHEEDMRGKAGLVYMATSNPGDHPLAIKRQTLDHPDDKQSTAYRELLIMRTLTGTIQGPHNFVKLMDWNKCWIDQTPPRKARSKDPSAREPVQCMNFVMKQAGQTLRSLSGPTQSLSLYLFKQILFQVLFSLARAQETCEFMHNDLHLGNILFEQRPHQGETRYHLYTTESYRWLVDASVVVTIVDFGLSRLTLSDGTVVHNATNSTYLPSRDVEHLAKQFAKFRITAWSELGGDNSTTLANTAEEMEKRQKSLKRSLMRSMTKGCVPHLLLQHEFFDSMRHTSTTSASVVNLSDKSQMSPSKNTRRISVELTPLGSSGTGRSRLPVLEGKKEKENQLPVFDFLTLPSKRSSRDRQPVHSPLKKRPKRLVKRK